jgi:Ribosomal protein L21E
MHKRSRNKLRLSVNERGKTDMKRVLQSFSAGDRVMIKPDPRIQRNIPHRSFFGSNGVVLGRKGKAYTVEVLFGGKAKRIDLLAVHMRKL